MCMPKSPNKTNMRNTNQRQNQLHVHFYVFYIGIGFVFLFFSLKFFISFYTYIFALIYTAEKYRLRVSVCVWVIFSYFPPWFKKRWWFMSNTVCSEHFSFHFSLTMSWHIFFLLVLPHVHIASSLNLVPSVISELEILLFQRMRKFYDFLYVIYYPSRKSINTVPCRVRSSEVIEFELVLYSNLNFHE